jgi:hypothetical protein
VPLDTRMQLQLGRVLDERAMEGLIMVPMHSHTRSYKLGCDLLQAAVLISSSHKRSCAATQNNVPSK